MATHLQALNDAVTPVGDHLRPHHWPVVELARTLASQMDAAGADPSTRLSAAYLSALKDFQRIMAGFPDDDAEDPVLALKRKRRERAAQAGT